MVPLSNLLLDQERQAKAKRGGVDDPSQDNNESQHFINYVDPIQVAAATASRSIGVNTNTAMVIALNALEIAATNLSSAQLIAPILDPHSLTSLYDLSSQYGLNDFSQAREPLDTKWDSFVDLFPPFLLALRIYTNISIRMLWRQL